MKCNKDCFNCPYPDCINNRVYPESSLYKNRPKEQQQYQKDYAKKRRDVAREKGFCIVCQKKPATKGSKCYECYVRQKRYDKAKYDNRRALWVQNGLCYFCGKEPIKSKKVCSMHYEILQRNIEKCNNNKNTQAAREEFKKFHNLLFQKKQI